MLDIQDRDDGRVRVVTLNRPDALNAFDTPLYNACADALRSASADDIVRCVVLTGRGRAFSSGQDLGEMGRLGSGESDGTAHGFPNLLAAVTSFDKPLIAAVNGIAVGIGFTVLLHCDLVVVAHAARMRAPFVPLGVVPEAAGSLLMPEVMGTQAAAHMLYTGTWLQSDDAVACGLAWKRVPDEELLSATFAITDEIARMPTISLVESKRLVLAAKSERIQAARDREDAAFARLVGGPANMEAITAFLEKRDPVF
jgi:enoyl-CoA hydratase/carnithine racemase